MVFVSLFLGSDVLIFVVVMYGFVFFGLRFSVEVIIIRFVMV